MIDLATIGAVRLNFLIPGRAYSVRVRPKVDVVDSGPWSDPYHMLDQNFKYYVQKYAYNKTG